MLSKTSEYALRAVVFLATRGRIPSSANVVAEHTKVPRRYLHKVLQDLVAHGLVASRPGPGGGYELSRESSEIMILEVVNAVDPIKRIVQCPLGLVSHESLCPLHKQLDDVYAATEAALGSVTIESVINSTSPIKPLCEIADFSASPSDEPEIG